MPGEVTGSRLSLKSIESDPIDSGLTQLRVVIHNRLFNLYYFVFAKYE
jgi:hypothetical protein